MLCYLLLCVSMHAKHINMLTFAFLLQTPLSKGLTGLLVWDRGLISASYAWVVLFLKRKSVLLLDTCDSQHNDSHHGFTQDTGFLSVLLLIMTTKDSEPIWVQFCGQMIILGLRITPLHIGADPARGANQHCIQTIIWTKETKKLKL